MKAILTRIGEKTLRILMFMVILNIAGTLNLKVLGIAYEFITYTLIMIGEKIATLPMMSFFLHLIKPLEALIDKFFAAITLQELGAIVFASIAVRMITFFVGLIRKAYFALTKPTSLPVLIKSKKELINTNCRANRRGI